jgi:hypothetical protein
MTDTIGATNFRSDSCFIDSLDDNYVLLLKQHRITYTNKSKTESVLPFIRCEQIENGTPFEYS